MAKCRENQNDEKYRKTAEQKMRTNRQTETDIQADRQTNALTAGRKAKDSVRL